MENYFEFDGKYYAVDMEAIMDFVTKQKQSETERGQSITQTYSLSQNEDGENTNSNGIQLVNKEVTESLTNTSETMSTYRYQLVTNMLNLILVPISDGNGQVMLTNSSHEMHLGQRIAFNTLLEMEIIYEIDQED